MSEQLDWKGKPLFNNRTPCKECPWSRKTPPGGLFPGGSPVSTYIGQVNGPFALPCHMRYEPGVGAKQQDLTKVSACAGSAIFRANIDRAKVMPKGMYALPENRELVFKDFAEWLCHQTGMSRAQAEQILREYPPDALTQMEMADANCRIVKVKP